MEIILIITISLVIGFYIGRPNYLPVIQNTYGELFIHDRLLNHNSVSEYICENRSAKKAKIIFIGKVNNIPMVIFKTDSGSFNYDIIHPFISTEFILPTEADIEAYKAAINTKNIFIKFRVFLANL